MAHIQHAVGSERGDNAIRIEQGCLQGQVLYNLVQGYAGSFVYFRVPVDEPVDVNATFDQPRFDKSWVVAWNIVENAGGVHGRPPVLVNTSGCSVNCLSDLRVAHNTFYVPVTVPAVVLIDGQDNTLSDLSVVNNLFYLQSGSVFVALPQAQPLTMMGNAYLQLRGADAVYLHMGDSAYISLEQMVGAGFEWFVPSTDAESPFAAANESAAVPWSSPVAVGSEFTLSPVALARLSALPAQPMPTADPATGDVKRDSTVPDVFGDVINGLGECVDSAGAPLDVICRCPGHERRLVDSFLQQPQGIIEVDINDHLKLAHVVSKREQSCEITTSALLNWSFAGLPVV